MQAQKLFLLTAGSLLAGSLILTASRQSVARLDARPPVGTSSSQEERTSAGEFRNIRTPGTTRQSSVHYPAPETNGDTVLDKEAVLAFARCANFAPKSEAQIEDLVVEFAAEGGVEHDHGRAMTADESLSEMRAKLIKEEEDCRGVEGMSNEAYRKAAFAWISANAARGDPDAQALYGSFAFDEFSPRDSVLHAEEIRRRKQLASDYLEASFRKGDSLALLQSSTHFASGDLFPQDVKVSYAYLYAYSLAGHSPDISDDFFQLLLANAAARLSEADRVDAAHMGIRYAACCRQ